MGGLGLVWIALLAEHRYGAGRVANLVDDQFLDFDDFIHDRDLRAGGSASGLQASNFQFCKHDPAPCPLEPELP